MAFEGLIVTDDLEMGAIAKQQGVAQGACQAFRAGADILLICKEQEKVLESIELLRNKMLQGELELDRLDQSLRRIERMKSRFLTPTQEISAAKVQEYFHLTA